MPAIYLTPAVVAAADEIAVSPIDLQHLAACEIAAVFGENFRFHRLDALISVLLFVYEPTAGPWFTVAPYSTDPRRGTRRDGDGMAEIDLNETTPAKEVPR
jgi:hypothetical protein